MLLHYSSRQLPKNTGNCRQQHGTRGCLTNRYLLTRSAKNNEAITTAEQSSAETDSRSALSSSTSDSSQSAAATSSTDAGGTTSRRVRTPDSTDAVASFLSRRFGLAGGLAWLGILAVGTLGEQVKTRMEVAAERAGTQDVGDMQEVVLPSGVAYVEERVGGGQTPIKGYLVVVDYIGRANGVEFENTKKRGKPIVFLYGGRPFTGGICPGVEQVMSTMRAGSKRRMRIPASLGFGEKGFVLRPTEHVPEKQGIVPPGADLEYDLELVRVSIPPS